MAAHNTIAGFPGTGAYRMWLEVDVSSFHIVAYTSVQKLSGSGFWTATPQWWQTRIAGQNWSGTWTYDFRRSAHIAVHGPIHKDVGVGQHWVEGWVNMDSGFGQAYSSQMHTFASVPPAPNSRELTALSPTSLRYIFDGRGDGGSGILEWQAQLANNTDFNGAVTVSSSGTQVFNDLFPGTRYYARSRGRNAVGWGAWSNVGSAATLPSTPPVVNATPSVSGQGSTITLAPPSGVSGVTEYNIEYRLAGTTTATTITSTTTTRTVAGLIPGRTYEFRANAEIGTYTSPWSSWVAVTQPNPNTSPGDFFDGSTAARDNITYAWTGAVGGSISEARAVGVEGWGGASTGTARIVQVTTGLGSGVRAARMLFLSDAPSAGSRLGMANAPGHHAAVEQLVYYVGSIVASPSRAQRLAARITYLTFIGAPIVSYHGDQVVVPAGGVVRLTVAAQAPPTAAWAIVEAVDIAGSGWSAWQGGDWLDADAAMITLDSLYPYFDGNTPDEPGFIYAWEGEVNRSISSRTTVEVAVPDPLQDPDCDPIPTPPRPPKIEAACIVEVGEWRRYTLAIPASAVRRWSAAVPTVILQTGGTAERQVRIRFYPNPNGVSADLVDKSVWEAELILTYIPALTELTIDGVARRTSARVGGAEPVTANHLLYGTGGGPATWPELACGVGYVITLDTPLEAPAGNLTSRMLLTQRM